MEIGSNVAFKQILIQHHLDDFEALWAVEGEFVEEGNIKPKSGHSHVVRLSLKTDNTSVLVYMKKQTNYATTLSRLLHRTSSICRREYHNIHDWHQRGLPTVEGLYCAEVKNPLRGILITRALEDSQSLDDFLKTASPEKRQSILRDIAKLTRRIHQAGRVHRCLFPKHVFVRADDHALTLIDLEKARKSWCWISDHARELASFMRRLEWKSEAEYQQFLNDYMEALPGWHQFILKWLLGRRIQRYRRSNSINIG